MSADKLRFSGSTVNRNMIGPDSRAVIGNAVVIELEKPIHWRKKMMSNPFEDETGTYVVLINEEGQYSLWPSFADVPPGWSVIYQADNRQACLNYINEHWTDMRPKSLIKAMGN